MKVGRKLFTQIMIKRDNRCDGIIYTSVQFIKIIYFSDQFRY